jgi:hypothetical protein
LQTPLDIGLFLPYSYYIDNATESNMNRTTKIEALSAEANVSREVAAAYLLAEEWVYLDALESIRADRRGGLL